MVTYGFPAFAAGVGVVSCGGHFLRGADAAGVDGPNHTLSDDIFASEMPALHQALKGALNGPLRKAALRKKV